MENGSPAPLLAPTRCAICGTTEHAHELYPARLDAGDVSDGATFSARHLNNQKIHFRIVSCDACGLVRSDPALPPAELGRLYTESGFTYQHEVAHLRKTYGRYLARLDQFLPAKERFLEIGCGNGFLLSEARNQGFREVYGVEPSREAIAAAPPDVRPHIRVGMFSRDMFAPASLDVIGLFQTLDHMPDPVSLLQDSLFLLKPGGIFLAFNHNVKSWSARLLRGRSPIIDVGHTYLYDPVTIRQLCEQQGFVVRDVGRAWNKLTLGYLLSLLPVSVGLKNVGMRMLRVMRAEGLPLWLPLGNLCVIAQKPLSI